jgi:uncharacterized protein YecE (DUF72 family)
MIRIGISGWTYAPWRGVFYPKDLAQKRELEYASRQLNSIEINGTFYSLQRPSSYQTWYDQTPDDFLFSVKGPRFITHIRRLKDIDEPLANFFASGLLCLKEKLGPILWQFPPNLKFDAERFEPFFKLLPHDTQAAANLAKKHSDRVKGRAHTETDKKRPLRHAIEFRHESFCIPEFVQLARKYEIAIVIADTGGLHPYTEDVTSDFLYLRLHGPEEIYSSGYDEPALKRWATRIQSWSKGSEPKDAKRISENSPPASKKRDIYVYFDNDLKVRSPRDAMALQDLLGSAASNK